jgi:hypothetical protein
LSSKSIEEFYKALVMEGRLTFTLLYGGTLCSLSLDEFLLMKALKANLDLDNKNLNLMKSANVEEFILIMKFLNMITIKGFLIRESISCSELLYLKFLMEKDKNYNKQQTKILCDIIKKEVHKKK